jgi:hypothetical protein
MAAAIAHPLEQAAATMLASATGGLTAGGFRLATSGGAAAAATLEQAGGRFLVLAHHRKANHGHQHGDRPQHDTIHLELLPRVNGKQKCTSR